MAVLEDQLGDAEGGAGGEQVGERRRSRRSAAPGRRPAAAGSRGPRTTPIASGVFAAAPLEVVVLGRRAANQRAGRQLVAQAVDRRRRLRRSRDRRRERPDQASPSAPGCARQHRGDAGVLARRRRGGLLGLGGRGDHLKRARRAVSERGLDPLVALARGIALGHDLDRGHRGVQAQDRERERRRARRARGPRTATAAATAARPSARSAASGARPLCAHGSASLSTRGPSFASTAGSSVSVAASTKRTESMIPSAHRRGRRGSGTSITAKSEISTVRAENSTALPAVSIVTAVASGAERRLPKKACETPTLDAVEHHHARDEPLSRWLGVEVRTCVGRSDRAVAGHLFRVSDDPVDLGVSIRERSALQFHRLPLVGNRADDVSLNVVLSPVLSKACREGLKVEAVKCRPGSAKQFDVRSAHRRGSFQIDAAVRRGTR